jgi:5-methyltetrahydropteroyltriglutamate--homocysteine methyltransferase
LPAVRRSGERFLTTHVGSLPRGTELLDLLRAKDERRPTDANRLDEVVRTAVEQAVAQQVDAGLDVVNDGEQGKLSFQTYRYQRLSGFELVDAAEAAVDPAGAPEEARDFPEFYEGWTHAWRSATARRSQQAGPTKLLCCTGPIGWQDFSDVERDLANLSAAAEGVGAEEIFMTAISPGTYAPPNLYYSTECEYLEAMADAMAREYEAIVAAGFVLQIDAPDLTTMYRLRDITPAQLHERDELCIAAINRGLRNVAPGRVRVHVCWGADEAPHHRDVPLETIVHQLLELRAEGLAIPGANGRHAHEWRVWQDVPLPDDKVLVAGVIDSTTNIIEHPDVVAERIGRYADVVGRERLIAGVDCGFGTVAGVNQVDARIVWAKLRSLAEGAALASERR